MFFISLNYAGASVGMTIPEMDERSAKLKLLKEARARKIFIPSYLRKAKLSAIRCGKRIFEFAYYTGHEHIF